MALRSLYFAFCAALRLSVRADRAMMSALAKVSSRDRHDCLVVMPATLLR